MTASDRILDLSLLWREAGSIYPGFHRLSLDWDETYRTYLEKVLAEQDELAHHLLLMEFLNLLRDGHTEVLPPRQLLDARGALPFQLLYAEGRYCVGAAAAEGAPLLMGEVLAVNGIAFQKILEQLARYTYRVGDYISPDALGRLLPLFLRPRGNVLETSKGSWTFALERERPEMQDAPSPVVSVPCVMLSQERPVLRLYAGDILYIRTDDLLTDTAAPAIAAAIREHPNLRGVVLDLRHNIGGMTLYGARIAELFLSGEFHGCRKRTRILDGLGAAGASQILRMTQEEQRESIRSGLMEPGELEEVQAYRDRTRCRTYTDCFGAPDHRALYDGPVVLLTARGTVSAAEDLTALFRSNHRARIIGTPTFGSTGTPMLLSLPGRGRARICSVYYTLLDGTEFIGRGIQPDRWVGTQIADLKCGLDAPLQAALEELGRFA